MKTTIVHRWVEDARNGVNPRVIACVEGGWVVMGEAQPVEGYCLLLPDPVVPHMNALEGKVREAFCRDLLRLGDVLLELTGAIRMNYEVLGNVEPALHAHVFPRYENEPEDRRTKPVISGYDWSAVRKFDLARDQDFMNQVREKLLSD